MYGPDSGRPRTQQAQGTQTPWIGRVQGFDRHHQQPLGTLADLGLLPQAAATLLGEDD